MYDRLRNYIDEIFSEAPGTLKTVEVKEEILRNLTDKYNDLLAEGNSEEAAFNIAAAGVGDVSGLVAELQGMPGLRSENFEKDRSNRQRHAALISVAVVMYILCVIPAIVFDNDFGVILMLIIAAAATGLVIYGGMTKTKTYIPDGTIAEEFQEWRGSNSRGRQIYKAVSSAIWSLGLVAYFLISFSTGAWHITWIIFPAIGAVNQIVKAVFDLRK